MRRCEVKITNRADEPVRLFHELRWGFVGGTQIVISTSEDGQTVHPRLLEHDGLMPREGSDPDNYIALAPRHFFGSSRVVDVASYFPAAGKYRVRIEYSPPVGAKLGGRPTLQTSWSASSRTTFITIKP
ncbi:MAG TPA: hypothetical protein VE010_23370 [Thermoanaerobaculia bacterium]|nr:hypothetical protein [Thermoanaerobaculia bacterium]